MHKDRGSGQAKGVPSKVAVEDSRSLVEGAPIFGGLSSEALDFLEARFETVVREPGEYFLREGDPPDGVYVLAEGNADVVKNNDGRAFAFATITRGACFGETAFVEVANQAAGVRASTACRAVHLSSKALHELYKHDLPQFTLIQMNLGREIARRFTTLGQILFEYSLAGRRKDIQPLVEALTATLE